MTPCLDDRFKPAIKQFGKAISGAQPFSENARLSCATTTNKNLGMAVSAIYIKEHFHESAKTEIGDIVKSMIEAFRQNLDNTVWLDEETKLKAEEKINKTRFALGYPDFLLNKTALNEYYGDLVIESGKYFENILNVRKFQITKGFKKLNNDESIYEDDWFEPPTVVNAYFENDKNRILLPASFLQPPIYHKDFPNAIKYGAIGAFIGHEVTHGFDSNGRSFNKKGKFESWWTNSSLESFTEREQCFIDQYDQFSLYNESISGDISKGENIADNAGIQLAFKVYNQWLKTRTNIEKEAEMLPGLEFLSLTQLFFLSYAQSWCDYVRPEAAIAKSSDEHPPGSVRILGTLQNFDEFSKAFQCSENSKMNPSKRCKLW
ncbi:neprilysin-4-like [Condylostylus longicornis]|uniref:neprilysin-4-like n=1 Tax=Condylostylus longicornis TaxID=2530218 RepID=UPI00244E482F|nr:neprilysin-4-like [Condylostylus longicornis]